MSTTANTPTNPTTNPTTEAVTERARRDRRTRPDRSSRADRLVGVDLLRGCTASDRRIVARHVEFLAVEAGTVLARAGDPATNLFFVLRGVAEVHAAGGRQPIGAGGHVGELALLAGSATVADVVAVTDVELGVLGARMFHVLCRDLPPFNRRVLADLAARLIRRPG